MKNREDKSRDRDQDKEKNRELDMREDKVGDNEAVIKDGKAKDKKEDREQDKEKNIGKKRQGSGCESQLIYLSYRSNIEQCQI